MLLHVPSHNVTEGLDSSDYGRAMHGKRYAGFKPTISEYRWLSACAWGTERWEALMNQYRMNKSAFWY